jgi:hypothetical protein
MKKVISVLLVLFSVNVLAADSSVIWQSDTFVAPYNNNIIAVSNEIANNNEFYEAVKLTVHYDDIQPSGSNCLIKAAVEEEISPGVWVTLAEQFEWINSLLLRPNRQIVVSKQINFEPGVPLSAGADGELSLTTGNVPEKFRIVVFSKPNTACDITSVKLTAYSLLYN